MKPQTNYDLLILKENHHFIIKMTTLSIWAFLTLIIILGCAIPYFAFSPSDMGIAEGVVSVILYGVFQFSKNNLNKEYQKNEFGKSTTTDQ